MAHLDLGPVNATGPTCGGAPLQGQQCPMLPGTDVLPCTTRHQGVDEARPRRDERPIMLV